MPIDFTLTPEQLRLRGDARAFARDVLSKVESAIRDLTTPIGTALLPILDRHKHVGSPPGEALNSLKGLRGENRLLISRPVKFSGSANTC